MRAEVAEHLRPPKDEEILDPAVIEERHAAAEARLAREVDDVAAVLNPVVTTYDGPPPQALQPVMMVRGEAVPIVEDAPTPTYFERRIALVKDAVGGGPIRRWRANRVIRRERRELFPEDFR